MVCPYEPAAEPKFQALMERYKGKDVVQLAIASNQGELGPEPAKDSKEPAYPEIREHVQGVMEILKVLRYHARSTYVEDGVLVRHGETVFRDVEK